VADLYYVMNEEFMHSHSASNNEKEEHDEIVFISNEVLFQAESVEEVTNACDLHRESMPEMVNEEENNAFMESVSDNGNEAESEEAEENLCNDETGATISLKSYY